MSVNANAIDCRSMMSHWVTSSPPSAIQSSVPPHTLPSLPAAAVANRGMSWLPRNGDISG